MKQAWHKPARGGPSAFTRMRLEWKDVPSRYSIADLACSSVTMACMACLTRVRGIRRTRCRAKLRCLVRGEHWTPKRKAAQRTKVTAYYLPAVTGRDKSTMPKASNSVRSCCTVVPSGKLPTNTRRPRPRVWRPGWVEVRPRAPGAHSARLPAPAVMPAPVPAPTPASIPV